MRRFVIALAAMALSAAAAAGAIAPGTYRCASYNVSGAGGSCRYMQPLVLHADGTYQYSSTRGRWNAVGGKLHLSESRLWGDGEIVGGNVVRFEYDYRGWYHVVTFACQECASAEAARTPATRGGGVHGGAVGVSLTLEFGTPVGGVNGFEIVPIEFAAAYTHNAPLPKGSVQGLAWARTATSVTLSTNRYNRLPSGRRYVVFLDWPAETLPVATLELPPGNADYRTTLPASLHYQLPKP